MVFKYLNPQHVIITRGFDTIDPTITVRITEIATMQLVECCLDDDVNMVKEINGISKLFLAPEIQLDSTKASAKADVYSLGVILYALIAYDLKVDTSEMHS